MTPQRRRRLPPARRWVQGALLLGFLLLFARTAYRGQDVLQWPVHLAFRLDPLAALAEVLAAGASALTWAWLGAGLLLALTALLGRFFCGWACPLGTTLDLLGGGLRHLAGRRGRSKAARLPPWTGWAVLAGVVTASALGLPLLGLLDPLSVLLRSLTLSLHPLLDAGAKAALLGIERSGLPVAAPGAEALYDLLKPRLLSFGRPAFLLSCLTGLTFAALVALELRAPRFWCAHLCPLGALLGLASRLSPLRRRKALGCGPCRACEAACPTGAALGDPADPSLCLQCGDCRRLCPQGARRLRSGAPALAFPAKPARRALLSALGLGAAAALVPRVRAEEREAPWDLLRPPGAKPEEEFRKRCIRCGACMRVCPRGALHPCLLEAGLAGAWTPRLVPRIGYCEYHCRLCGQVCPTGAIGYLEAGQKERAVLGIAHFEAGRCLPYRKAQDCMVCEEHCPTSPKAIVFQEELRPDPLGVPRRVKVPKVVEERCVGCGICENRCPLPGRGAIRVSREVPQALQQYY